MLLYYGILYLNNSGSPRPINHSVLQLIILLYLPSPHISFTRNSKPSSLINPFLLSLFAPTHVGSLALWSSPHRRFHSIIHPHLVHIRQCL